MIIGISGKIGSGKTTIAKRLNQMGYEHKSFAENLRKVCSIVGGYKYGQDRTPEEKAIVIPAYSITRGEFLQDIGTNLRKYNADIWVNSLMVTLYRRGTYVIDDVRYINEFDAIRERGGIMIRLTGDPGGVRANSTRNLNHTSETALDNAEFDLYINTDDMSIDQCMQLIYDYLLKDYEFE